MSPAAGPGPASPAARSPAPGPSASLAAHRLLDDPGDHGIGQVQVLGPLRHGRRRGPSCASLRPPLQAASASGLPASPRSDPRRLPSHPTWPVVSHTAPRAKASSSSSSSSATSPASASSGRSARRSTPRWFRPSWAPLRSPPTPGALSRARLSALRLRHVRSFRTTLSWARWGFRFFPTVLCAAARRGVARCLGNEVGACRGEAEPGGRGLQTASGPRSDRRLPPGLLPPSGAVCLDPSQTRPPETGFSHFPFSERSGESFFSSHRS